MAAKFTAQDWDEVRSAFASSIMVDTALSSLAQNLDGPDWPVKGKDETPAKYVDLSYEETIELLALKNLSAEHADLLIGILKETLAFDNPFGDMVQQTAAAAQQDNPLLKNMARLEISTDLPIVLSALGPEALEFCRLEKLNTLGEFALFAQNMAQSVIVGGDFRKLLNSLSHIDERTLAECLPFRPGAKGLHLLEAVAQAARSPAPEERTAAAVAWFEDEVAALDANVAAGGSLSRHLVALGDPAVEARVAALLKPHLVRTAARAAESTAQKKSGLFGSLSRFFKK